MSKYQLFARKPDGTEFEFDPVIEDETINLEKIPFKDSNLYTTLDRHNETINSIENEIEQMDNRISAQFSEMDSKKQDKSSAVTHQEGISVGSAFRPVYVDENGNVRTTVYSIEVGVPSNAIFTDRYVNSIEFTPESNGLGMKLVRAGSDKVSIESVMPQSSPTSYGVNRLGQGIKENISPDGNTYKISLKDSNYFVGSLSESSTDLKIFEIDNKGLNANCGFEFILSLKNFGGSQVIWPENVKWENGFNPTLSTDGIDILKFFTFDGGSSWFGKQIIVNAKTTN